jgi:ABC-type amino acid transport substrate-binding protein
MSLARCCVTALLVASLLCFTTAAAGQKTYVLTTSKNSPPFSFLDQEGSPQGVVVDFWKMWAERTGVQVQFCLDDWQRTLELVRNSEVDAHAGLYYSHARDEYLDFSNGYLNVTTSVFVLDKLNVKSLDELGDLPLATSAGYFAAEYLRERYPRLKIRLYSNNESVIKSALAGEALVFAMEYPVAQYYLSRYEARGRFRVLKNLFTEKFHAGVRKGNAELLKVINQGIAEISEDDTEQLYRKWALEDKTIPEWVLKVITVGGVALVILVVSGYWVLLKMELRRKTAELLEKNRAMEIMNHDTVQANKTIQSQIERLESLSTDKDEILSMIAREMQAPVREILRAIEGPSWQSLEVRDKAVEHSRRLLHVIDEITKISEIEYESYRGKMEKVNLTEVLKKERDECKGALKLRDVELSLVAPPHEVPVLIHSEHFDLVCKNLLGVATKPGHGGGKVTLTLETRESDEGERAILTLRFWPIQLSGESSGRPSVEERGGEVGNSADEVGMAFIEKVVDLHKGRLRVETAGAARTIQLELPLARKVAKRYEDLEGKLQTGDLVLFKGLYLYGHLATSEEDWSHIGMVVRLPGVAGPLLWESTLEGEIPDQEFRRKKTGPQLVSLQERLSSYETDIYAVRFLKVARNAETMKRLYEFIYEVHQLPFPTEFQIIKRVLRARLLTRLLARKWRFRNVFCSELIAESYVRMGLLPPHPPSSGYLPVDFSSKKQLPLLRGAYLGPEVHIDLPEKKYVPRDPLLLAQAGHGRI